MAARHTADIIFKLDNLKRSIDDCHPQVPSLAVETALLIERHASAGNIDEVFTDKSFEELNDTTRLFEHTCICERTITPIRRVKQIA
jgi:hypothetical protein